MDRTFFRSHQAANMYLIVWGKGTRNTLLQIPHYVFWNASSLHRLFLTFFRLLFIFSLRREPLLFATSISTFIARFFSFFHYDESRLLLVAFFSKTLEILFCFIPTFLYRLTYNQFSFLIYRYTFLRVFFFSNPQNCPNLNTITNLWI